jgi:spermidine synthase
MLSYYSGLLNFFMNIYKKLFAQPKQCLYQSKQGIQVYQYRHYRWVLFNELYVQTIIDTKKLKRPILPYLKPMLTLLSLQPERLCFLGLGGGGVIHALPPTPYPITVVEKFPEMIEIAKKFFFIQENPNLSIICDCAANFLNTSDQQFNQIVIDLGDEYGFPEVCQNLEFFSNAHQRLNDEGILILNLPNHHQIKEFYSLLQVTFKQRPLSIEAQGNCLLIVSKGEHARDNLIHQLNRKHLISRFEWDPKIGEQITLNTPLARCLQRLKHKFLQSMGF